jgi:hypothetical protein
MSFYQQMLTTQAAVETELLSKRNVVGVAVGYKESDGHLTDEIAIVALVEKKEPLSALAVEERVPRSIDGIRTDVFEVGKLVAQQSPSPRQRFRPSPGGVSIGHTAITAGTLGCIVRDRNSGRRLILSNSHVLANSNDANVGDAIVQPGPTDGGRAPGDTIATLERFVPLRYIGEPVVTPPPVTTPPGCAVGAAVAVANFVAGIVGSGSRVVVTNTAGAQSAGSPTMPTPTVAPQTVTSNSVDNALDAALAVPVNDELVTNEIFGIGTINGTKAPTLGMSVRKSGRTTGFTTGVVQLINATVNVAYGAKTARFTGQVITSAMSEGGDSGSLIVDAQENMAVGLLFAGSPVATIFTPIDVVLAALDVTFAMDITV